ncbi:MAG TPA: metallophosphoesterase family protein [Methanoculleus sp.]|mgnify:CR=1 FL=1|nr:metallophosphoesterase family protein [Methanoculleus sp.]
MSRCRNAHVAMAAAVLLALLLTPAASAGIVWGPYVTNTSEHSAVVTWKTDPPTTGWIEYTPEGGETYRIPSPEREGVCHALLADLTPATTYRYRVGAGNETTGDCRFRTFGDDAFTCIIYGDTRGQKPFFTQSERHGLVAERIAAEEDILFVIHTGDFVCEEGEWDEFFAIAGPVLRNTTLVPVPGNHDGSVEAFSSIFALPAYYSFDAGSLHVTVLDSNDRAWADMGIQTAWLEDDLASPLPRKIVAFHHPPFSSDRQHPGGDRAIRDEWCGILSENSVDAVVSAHTHAYERYRADGTEYLVVGCGGAPFYALTEEKTGGYQTGCERTLGYLRATVSPESVVMEMVPVAEITEDGEVTMYQAGDATDTVRLPAPESGEWWNLLTSLPGKPELSELWR